MTQPVCFSAFERLEAFDVTLGDVSLFAGLSFSANMTVPEVQALYDKVSKFEAQLGKQLAFFSLELGALVKAKPELIAEPVLAGYTAICWSVFSGVWLIS